MKKNTICIILSVLLLNFSFGQELKDKNILVVWGGWDGHHPELFAKHIEKWLISENVNYKIHNGVDAYSNYEELIKYDLIIQSVTMGQINELELDNLLKAVKNGVGFSGAHGGIADSFRNNPSYQFMVGGQWVLVILGGGGCRLSPPFGSQLNRVLCVVKSPCRQEMYQDAARGHGQAGDGPNCSARSYLWGP